MIQGRETSRHRELSFARRDSGVSLGGVIASDKSDGQRLWPATPEIGITHDVR